MAVYMGGVPQKQVTLDWIGEAFNEFKKYPGIWIGILLLAAIPPYIVIIGAEYASGIFPKFGSPPATAPPSPSGIAMLLLAELACALYGAWVGAGILKMAATQIRGEPIDIHAAFGNSSRMWAFLGYAFVAGIIMDIGFIFCVFPGFVAMALFYPGLVLVADGVSFSEAINRSVNGMKANWAMGGLLALCFSLLYLVSALPCGLGLLVTGPMGILLAAIAAREMCGLRGPAPADFAVGYAAPTPSVWPPPPTQQTPTGQWPPPNPTDPGAGQTPPEPPAPG